MNVKSIYLIILVSCLLLCVIPPVAAASVNLSWNRSLDYCITALDTNPQGTLIFAGLNNGTIFAYDNTGNVSWVYSTNSSTPAGIKKIVTDSIGDLVWSNEANQTGYISSTGAVLGITNATLTNITDIGISSNGGEYVTTELNPPRITVRNPNGNIFIQNTSYGDTSTNSTRWTYLAFDPNKNWLVTANESSNILYFWNFTSWTGWEQFNPTHSVGKNASQIFLDTYPMRANISVDGSGNMGIIFHNTSSVAYITQVNNTYFEYNALNTGKYFYWTFSGSLQSNQSNKLNNTVNMTVVCDNTAFCVRGLLNLSWFNETTGNYHVVLQNISTNHNYTIYFGNTTYNYTVVSSDWKTNGTQYSTIFTSSTTWTVPFGISNISTFMVGGGGTGGKGGNGDNSIHYGHGGYAGTAGAQATTASVAVGPGSSYPITIGTGAYWYYSMYEYYGIFVASTATSGFGLSANGGSSGASGGTGSYTSCNAAQKGADGVAGYIIGGSPSSTNGRDPSIGCVGSHGVGANGYGAAGGAGAGEYGQRYGTGGGAGAPGYMSISYYIYDVPVYYFGTAPTTSFLGPIQNIQTSTGMNQSSRKYYAGTIYGLSVPKSGGLISVSTDYIFYQQYMSSTGFGVAYCATLPSSGYPAAYTAPPPYVVSASNSGSASVEARGIYALIYDAGAVNTAKLQVGGIERAADSAMTSGDITAFGGDDGKLYILTDAGSPSWNLYYTGPPTAIITDVSVSWDGNSVAVGRIDGSLEYYLTHYNATSNGTTPGGGGGGTVVIPTTPDVTVYVFKDGAIYRNQPVTVYSSLDTVNFVPTGHIINTDGQGKMTYLNSSLGTYYKFVVNNIAGTTSGEGQQVWQSNSASTTVYIYILTPSTPYEWNSYYDDDNNNVTVIYSDSITPSSVTVTITDLKTNLQVVSQTYTETPSFIYNYHDMDGMGSYQVNIIIHRMGAEARDQRMVTSSNTFGITMPVDIYIVYGISTLFLMILAGLFSYANARRGGFAVVIVAVILMYFKLLPWSLITVVTLAAVFAVMSLFSSRVQ